MTTAPVQTTRTLTVALIGNPNTGKSTLFNALAGMQSRVGNFPGVTVEKKIGRVKWDGQTVELVDLPGTYSLSPRTLDEMVSVDVLLGRQKDLGPVDAVVCIVDAANLERNLYLVSQVLDVGLPVVLVLNMWDAVAERGLTVDAAALERKLGIPVVTTSAHRKRGLDEVRRAILASADRDGLVPPRIFPEPFYAECQQLRGHLDSDGTRDLPDYLLERALLDVGGYLESHLDTRRPDDLRQRLHDARERLKEQGCRVPGVEAKVRYGWVRETLDGVVTRPAERLVTASDRIDRVLTHRLVGLLIFAALMFLVFMAIFAWAEPFMGYIEAGQGWAASMVEGAMPPGPLRSLIVDGAIAGVGGVLVFVPQIAFLFLFIALLEDCGYMARAAFLMDKLMTRLGLSGKSFVPLMSSFACAIPGIMATRVIENRRDRMVTILVAPLMSCSARLPVYILLTSLFVPQSEALTRGLVLFAMYSLGALTAIPVAWLLKKTFFKGETPPFVMELPTYKWPSPWIVLARVYDRVKAFVVRAGTLIFATTVVVWALGYFPGDRAAYHRLQAEIEPLQAEVEEPEAALEELRAAREQLEALAHEDVATAAQDIADQLREQGVLTEETPESIAAATASVETEIVSLEAKVAPLREKLDPLEEEMKALSGRLIEQSALGRMGHAIEPAVRPMGWDWRIGVGVIASFPAREVIISTLGTIYSLGGDIDEEDAGLKAKLQQATWPDGRKVYTIPVALSIMVFFALCAQCAATLMVIRRETNSWFWPAFTFVYMTGLAYVAALITYQFGSMFFV